MFNKIMTYQEDLTWFIRYMSSKGGIHVKDNQIKFFNRILFFEDCEIDCISVGLHNIRIVFPSGKQNVYNFDTLNDIEKYLINLLKYSREN